MGSAHERVVGADGVGAPRVAGMPAAVHRAAASSRSATATTRWSKRAGMAASLRIDEPHPHRVSKGALRMGTYVPTTGAATPAPAARPSLAWPDDARPRRTAGRPGTPGARRGARRHRRPQDSLARPGHEHDDQALEDGLAPWRQGYPYDERMTATDYERDQAAAADRAAQAAGLGQGPGTSWSILFEGRDAAGKGGTIKRFMEHLNPRGARIVALEKPTERESSQWYFQRYVAHLPSAGEIVLFDRSWYNRAGVERVMGFCTPTAVPGVHAAGPGVRADAGAVRDPPDQAVVLGVAVPSSTPGSSSGRSTRSGSGSCRPPTLPPWTSGTTTPRPRRRCSSTPTPTTRPWTVVKSNDKKRARLEAMRHVLSLFDYAEQGRRAGR